MREALKRAEMESRITQLENENEAVLDAVRALLEHACDDFAHPGIGNRMSLDMDAELVEVFKARIEFM